MTEVPLLKQKLRTTLELTCFYASVYRSTNTRFEDGGETVEIMKEKPIQNPHMVVSIVNKYDLARGSRQAETCWKELG